MKIKTTVFVLLALIGLAVLYDQGSLFIDRYVDDRLAETLTERLDFYPEGTAVVLNSDPKTLEFGDKYSLPVFRYVEIDWSEGDLKVYSDSKEILFQGPANTPISFLDLHGNVVAVYIPGVALEYGYAYAYPTESRTPSCQTTGEAIEIAEKLLPGVKILELQLPHPDLFYSVACMLRFGGVVDE